jgi:transcriptional regulator with XRE-family HTH domain
MESKIAKVIEQKMKENDMSMYQLMQKSGIAQRQIDAVLQRKEKQGKTYTVHTLRRVLDAFGMTGLTIDMNGMPVSIKFKKNKVL